MSKYKITMTDIARRVGASPTAVSFVLNGLAREKGVSLKLEKRIKKAAEELNYRPSLLARSLSSKKSMMISIVLPKISINYGPMLLHDIEISAHQKGYQIILSQHEDNSCKLKEVINNILGRHSDGLIISPTINMKDLPVYQELKQANLPTVFIDRDPGDDMINFVTFDVGRSIELALQELINLGHKKIALYDAPLSLIESRRREMSYRMTLEKQNIQYNPSLIRRSSYLENEKELTEYVERDIASLMKSHNPPTAIISVSANRAIAIYQTLAKLGYDIPKDISLIAITGLQFTGFHRARITSVKFSYENVGHIAFKILMEAINDRNIPPRRVYIPPKLIKGDTIMPPKFSL